jgi:hypothetical protein
MPITTWAQIQAPGPSDSSRAVYDLVQQRINDPRFPMPPVTRNMSEADREVLNQWIEAGAPPAE